MKIENVTKLRDFLAELPDEQFAMDHLQCGTAACIAGWSLRLFPKEHYGMWGSIDYALLTMPPGYDDDNHRERYPRTRAVETLTRLIETGRVDWGKEPSSSAMPAATHGSGIPTK